MDQETVQPSPEPDAAVATGSGEQKDAAPPPAPQEGASTSGLGTQASQHGGPPPGDAPYDLAPERSDDQDTEARSDSGT